MTTYSGSDDPQGGVSRMTMHDSPYNFNKEKIMNLDDIIKLWYKTQMGHIDKCRENQLIFADIMWNLYEKLKEKE